MEGGYHEKEQKKGRMNGRMNNYITNEIVKINRETTMARQDAIIREMPLQIRINQIPCATLMRTPGQDKELALGFCFTEGILPDLWKVSGLQWDEADPRLNIIGFKLSQFPSFRPATPRWFDSTETSLTEISPDEEEVVRQILPSLKKNNSPIQVSLATLRDITGHVKKKQELFSLTGAAHAAWIFTVEGKMVSCGEDVARHNALDKAIGLALLEDIDLADKILLLSGRTNYTLIRKASRAGFPVVASISAPTSLAVTLSKMVGMTLIGFLRSGEMNIYAGLQRVQPSV